MRFIDNQYKINYAFMDPNIKDELIEKVYLYEDGTNNDGEALCIDMDKTYVEMMLTNLLSNAFKFTPNDGEITLSLWKKEKHFRIQHQGQRHRDSAGKNCHTSSSVSIRRTKAEKGAESVFHW